MAAERGSHPIWRDTRASAKWGVALRYAIARLKGLFYVHYFHIRGLQFQCGARLRVFGRLQLKGPGQVVLGADVVIHGKVTPWTHSPDARIVIGDNVVMDGTRFGCVEEITIGNDCIVADARIMDTDFHSIRAHRRSPAAPIRVAAVRIADNVWVGAAAALLPGTTIGRNSVVGFGAVCMGRYPADKVIIGNPAKVAAPIPAADANGPVPSRSVAERTVPYSGTIDRDSN
jgi:acetyltransferase-like isoleucine patch superfamily enzyme